MSLTRRVAVVVAVLLASGAGTALQAQGSCTTAATASATCNTTVTVPMVIGKTTLLQTSSATTFNLLPASGVLTVADYEAGAYDVATAITVTVRANATWNATIAAATPSFAAPCATKPAAHLLWGRSTTVRTTPMSVTPAGVFTATSNARTAGRSQVLYFRMSSLGWTTDPVGLCSLGMAFTVQAL
ncbi:MAG: hypothetical protein IT355_14775 [Gemmatimonadaceae bacterium]|nr:hypothetical protein [Gemmatimonadaceae bacterium]